MNASPSKNISKPLIPAKEEYISSKEVSNSQISICIHQQLYYNDYIFFQWLCKYGMEALGLLFTSLSPATNETNKPTKPKLRNPLNYKHINKQVVISQLVLLVCEATKYFLQGEVVELCVDVKGLKGHACKLRAALKRYHTRLNWLNKGAHQMFCSGIIGDGRYFRLGGHSDHAWTQ